MAVYAARIGGALHWPSNYAVEGLPAHERPRISTACGRTARRGRVSEPQDVDLARWCNGQGCQQRWTSWAQHQRREMGAVDAPVSGGGVAQREGGGPRGAAPAGAPGARRVHNGTVEVFHPGQGWRPTHDEHTGGLWTGATGNSTFTLNLNTASAGFEWVTFSSSAVIPVDMPCVCGNKNDQHFQHTPEGCTWRSLSV